METSKRKKEKKAIKEGTNISEGTPTNESINHGVQDTSHVKFVM